MIGRGGARLAARLLCAAAISALSPMPAAGQEQPPQELDPSAPLDPMPDLGVEWPELETKGAPSPAAPQASAPPIDAGQPSEAFALTDSASELRYEVSIRGLTELPNADILAAAFDEQSELRSERDEEANAAQIDRRLSADVELLAELLRSRGYYDAVVEPRIEQQGPVLGIVLEATPGPRYAFRKVELPGLDAAGEEAAGLRASFGVAAGDPVDAEDVIAAGLNLRVALGEEGFAFAEIGEQDIEIDHESRTAELRLPVRTGPRAAFGAIRVTGEPPFSARHVGRIARFERGEPFRRSKVDDLRRALVATGLVASAEVQLVPAADGRSVDLAVNLQPAPMRTVAGELGYGTGEGLRAEASWQHRNFFNPEGALTVRGVAGTLEQLAAVSFRRNNFRSRDQVLNLHAAASHIERDAYDAKTLLIGGNIERQSNIIWHKKWTWSVGADLLATDERGVFETLAAKDNRTFLIAALPASLGYDGSDDLLNPTEGFRLGGRISPEVSARGGGFTYARGQIDASAYRPVSDSIIAAGRVRLGTIVGADALSIAPSRRHYAGGGGSVRGYGYQQLGPNDVDGDPAGGRGLAEFSLEARIRLKNFGGNFGVVPFLDGGTLSPSMVPDLDAWQFGAGLGLRYYSNFGPIRVDVGTPLNPRGGDSKVAVTVSLGQAF